MRILSCDDPSLDISLYPDDTYNVLFMIAGTYTLTWSSDPPAQAVVDVYPSPMDITVDLGLGAWVEEEPAAGQEAQIWLDYANYSEDAIAFDAVLTATLDSRATFVSATREGAPITPTVAGNTLTFALGPLEPTPRRRWAARAPGERLAGGPRSRWRAPACGVNPEMARRQRRILEMPWRGPTVGGLDGDRRALPGPCSRQPLEYSNNGSLRPDAEIVRDVPAALTLVGAAGRRAISRRPSRAGYTFCRPGTGAASRCAPAGRRRAGRYEIHRGATVPTSATEVSTGTRGLRSARWAQRADLRPMNIERRSRGAAVRHLVRERRPAGAAV